MRKKYSLHTLQDQFPPSEACNCKLCRSYCLRPGWWSVEQAARAIQAGYAVRMMLEISPDRTFGVLSQPLKAGERNFGLQEYAHNGCTFLSNGLCELHGSCLEPLDSLSF